MWGDLQRSESHWWKRWKSSIHLHLIKSLSIFLQTAPANHLPSARETARFQGKALVVCLLNTAVHHHTTNNEKLKFLTNKKKKNTSKVYCQKPRKYQIKELKKEIDKKCHRQETSAGLFTTIRIISFRNFCCHRNATNFRFKCSSKPIFNV